ncbi:hypothetical protein DICSQDRAFT_139644 [Dichomitus squalens LYAD-421 SS1]|uniref:Uncharacterized protein n=1 Tax=Dichomitus squalens (strain LYAD-421) TaxID=732165 RepID=R7SR03_DICSQ|nr:uncharacterized protein DICSQDRAFT_139644 [Dichomitus squalens LYAD-421 SS1]EJF58160.1 hypothetical protein DICSQDRAFT_139644 [Dichomitus squalens LYAD-421 SS1]
MATIHFSWTDSFQAAVSSCLPCLHSSDPASDSDDHQSPRPRNPAFAHAIPPPRARPDELQGLLADTDDDADALSLHTNPGERRTRKKRRKQPKHIRVFGYDLFGRTPAVQLPESDDEDGARALGARRGAGDRVRTISTSTLDSDAAPLDASTIEELSAARHAEALAREEQERREKEERRRRRRERRELKRAAMARALELQANGEHEFEGFQGSGPVFGVTSPFSPSAGSGTGTGSGSITSSQQEFGPFAQGQPVEPFDPDAAEAAREAVEAEADGADFGGESYTSRPRKSKGKSLNGAGTMSTSDTRSSSSRGTGSQGYTYVPAGQGAAPYNHQFLASLQAPTHIPGIPRSPLSPLSQDADSVPPSPASPSTANVTERKKRRKSKSSKSLSVSTSSQSATTATASSLTSPPPSERPQFAAPRIVSPGPGGAQDDFEGFPGDFGSSDLLVAGGALVEMHADPAEDDDGVVRAAAKRSEYLPVAGFPSAGFRRSDSRNSDMGVFLAHRGDE